MEKLTEQQNRYASLLRQVISEYHAEIEEANNRIEQLTKDLEQTKKVLKVLISRQPLTDGETITKRVDE